MVIVVLYLAFFLVKCGDLHCQYLPVTLRKLSAPTQQCSSIFAFKYGSSAVTIVVLA